MSGAPECPPHNTRRHTLLHSTLTDFVFAPCSLRESIRLRLATAQDADPALHRLLQIAAVMGGGFAFVTLLPVWALLHAGEQDEARAEESMRAAVSRAVEQRFLKYVSSSGVVSASSRRRRRSSAANTAGNFVFQHLRIAEPWALTQRLISCLKPSHASSIHM